MSRTFILLAAAILTCFQIAVAGNVKNVALDPVTVTTTDEGAIFLQSKRQRQQLPINTGKGPPPDQVMLLGQGIFNGRRWILIDAVAPSRLIDFNGECGAGQEQWIVFATVGPDLKIVSSSATLYSSCWHRLYGDEPHLVDGQLKISVTCEHGLSDEWCNHSEKMFISFDSTRAEQGIVVRYETIKSK